MLTTIAAITRVFNALLNGCGGSTCAMWGPGPEISDISPIRSLRSRWRILAHRAHQHKLLKRPSSLDGAKLCAATATGVSHCAN